MTLRRKHHQISRRTLLWGAVFIAAPWATAQAEDLPYQASLIAGPSGELYQAGVLVQLKPGWKTYWREPGESGIAPSFDWSASTGVQDVTVHFPAPKRLPSGGGEVIGYQNEVVFPVTVQPKLGGPQVVLRLKMQFGVCKEICIPATFAGELSLPSAVVDARVARWLRSVPVQEQLITHSAVLISTGKAYLDLTLVKPPLDVFVETSTSAYFGAPESRAEDGHIVLPIHNYSPALMGSSVRITLEFADKATEQTLILTK